jgi:hypothetical protein
MLPPQEKRASVEIAMVNAHAHPGASPVVKVLSWAHIPAMVGGAHTIRVVLTVFMVPLPGLLIRGTIRNAR